MEWLLNHAEGLIALGGAFFTIIGWNFSQGFRLRAAEKELERQGKAIVALQSEHNGVQEKLATELTFIREKLAHIEGYLTAKRQAPRKE